jgi:HD-GYP domain-containing protein (c-di-GMP phosphodiesterase class II)
MGAVDNLKQNLLAMKLRPIDLREVLLMEHALGDLYHYENGLYSLIIPSTHAISRDLIKKLHQSNIKKLYIDEADLKKINEEIESKLILNSRSLSMGDVEKKLTKQVTLLSFNLNQNYRNPFNDDSLELQIKAVQNTSAVLMNNLNLTPTLYQQIKKQKQHFLIAQPLLSSLLVVGYLDFLKVYQDKDIQQLFLTSFIKDIGMSFIPEDQLEKKELNSSEKKLFRSHAKKSKSILTGRIQLPRNLLDIIENHHILNDKIAAIYSNHQLRMLPDQEIIGFETMAIAIIDILVAMTEDRPYREAISLFDSLELIKQLMQKDYPHEFKALVIYLKTFFAK